MKGVVGAGLGFGYFASKTEGSSIQQDVVCRDVGWSEEVEDEARLRNEVGDLMREKDVFVKYCRCEEEGNPRPRGFYIDSKSVLRVNIRYDKIVEIGDRTLKAGERFCYFDNKECVGRCTLFVYCDDYINS